eukprot:4743268-Prorocentrum_lima.AAC.1
MPTTPTSIELDAIIRPTVHYRNRGPSPHAEAKCIRIWEAQKESRLLEFALQPESASYPFCRATLIAG